MLHAEMSHDAEVKQRFLQEGYAANTIQHEGAVSVLDDDVAAGRLGVPRDGAPGGRDGRRAMGAERMAAASARGAGDRRAAARRAGGGAREERRPPRREAGEPVHHARGAAQGARLRHRARSSRRSGRGRRRRRAGVVMGTPAFMAPEQARARWDEVDGRTDLWAVGATMFTLLSGRHVHEGASGNEQLILSATTPARVAGAGRAERYPGGGRHRRSRAGVRTGAAVAGRRVDAAGGERGARRPRRPGTDGLVAAAAGDVDAARERPGDGLPRRRARARPR